MTCRVSCCVPASPQRSRASPAPAPSSGSFGRSSASCVRRTGYAGQRSLPEVAPGKADASVQTRFTGRAGATEAGEGLSLVLSAARLGSIKPGNAVTYREVKVGEVTGYELGRTPIAY